MEELRGDPVLMIKHAEAAAPLFSLSHVRERIGILRARRRRFIDLLQRPRCFSDIRCLPDLTGKDRVIYAR